MKYKVTYSTFANVLTALIFVALFAGCIASVHDKAIFFTLLPLFLILIICALFFGVAYIKADEGKVIMGSLLKSRKIIMRDIESAERFQPTMGAIRIFASGGFMGYWGIFREGDVGRYYAFYGKSSECFMIRMKNGDKYVLGCDRPDEIIAYIREHIKSLFPNFC